MKAEARAEGRELAIRRLGDEVERAPDVWELVEHRELAGATDQDRVEALVDARVERLVHHVERHDLVRLHIESTHETLDLVRAHRVGRVADLEEAKGQVGAHASMYQRCGGAGRYPRRVPSLASSVREVLATCKRRRSSRGGASSRRSMDAEPARLDADLEDVEAACAHFPDRLRPAPGRWLRRLFEGESQPQLRVARAIDIVLQDDGASGDRLAWTDAPELAGHDRARVR